MLCMMGQMFSTLNRPSKKGKRGRLRRKEGGGGERGLPFSHVCTLYSSDSDKLKYDRKPSVYTHVFRFVAVALRYSITTWVNVKEYANHYPRQTKFFR